MSTELAHLSNYFKKYNLGCGTSLYENYLNIGFWNHLQNDAVYKDLNGTTNTYMLNHDLNHGIPAHDNSLDLVYHSHMLEHLSFQEGIDFIKECFRVLRPGGMMRLLVPDLEKWTKAYMVKDDFFLGEYRKCLDGDIHVTPAAIFMGMLHNHGHKMGYDYETVHWVLQKAGFERIRRTLYSDSPMENIEYIEHRNPLRVMESLCVECYKP